MSLSRGSQDVGPAGLEALAPCGIRHTLENPRGVNSANLLLQVQEVVRRYQQCYQSELAIQLTNFPDNAGRTSVVPVPPSVATCRGHAVEKRYGQLNKFEDWQEREMHLYQKTFLLALEKWFNTKCTVKVKVSWCVADIEYSLILGFSYLNKIGVAQHRPAATGFLS